MSTVKPPRTRGPRPAEVADAQAEPTRAYMAFPRWLVWVPALLGAASCAYDTYVSFTEPLYYMEQPSYAIAQVLLFAMFILAPINVRWSTVFAFLVLVMSVIFRDAMGGLIAVFVPLFVLGVTRDRRWQAGFGVASVMWLIAMLGVGDFDWPSATGFTSVVLFITGVGTIIGEFRARHIKEVLELEEQAEEARSRERRLLARELHDVVAHELTVITMQSHVMQAAREPQAVEAARDAISATAGNALGELKRLLAVMNDDTAMLRVDRADRLAEEAAREATEGVLEPANAGTGTPTGDDADLAPLIDRLVGQLEAVGFTVHPEVAASPDLPRSITFAAGRLLREAATNVLKYGDTEVPVVMRAVTEGGEFVVDVVNGLPEVERAKVSQTGLGLTGLAERVRLLGGHLVLTSEDRTWRLRADIPLEVAGDVEGE
ncbi:MAG: histidine kinase [Dermatophilus congolensis]|nr:histidine kinase [Dermatophilus congolensis]